LVDLRTVSVQLRIAFVVVTALAIAALATCRRSPTPAEAPADLVLLGGSVLTLDAEGRRVEALAVRDGRLVVVGTEDEGRAAAGPASRVIDLGGRTVLPAFHDAHVHPVSAGVELGQCNLNDLATADAIHEAIGGCVEAQRGRPWLVGGGFVLTAFPGGAPDRGALDRLAGNQPVALSSSDGHTLWVNSAALELAGITRDTPDPPAGRIERDRQGEPTGVLRESAMALVNRHVPPTTPAEFEAGLLRALEVINRVGIVSFQEANASDAAVAAYRAVAKAGRLSARARLSLGTDPRRDASQADQLAATRDAVVEPGLSANTVKIFVDGVIEAGTAALIDPYLPLAGEPPAVSGEAVRGLPNFADAALRALGVRLDRDGFQLHLHAIGDAAVRQALDAIDTADRVNGRRDRRAHLAHVQLVAPADFARFALLDVTANIQPLWAYADSFITDLTEPRLGPERSRFLYPFASLRKAGARLAGGSDWSVTSVNPLHAIQVAVTRKAIDAPADELPWLPDERLDLTTALQVYTRGGAYLNFEDHVSGSLEVGKFADLIVLDRDPYAVPAHDLHTLQVLWTLKEGREVFRAASFTP
jgi:predicted amidohydrolase YtcJ